MHEYTIAYDIFATSKRAALENSATRIKKVCVDVGEMTMINPEQVIFLFETMCEDDALFKDCKLEAKTIPVKSICKCGYKGNEKYVCPNCGSLPEIIDGREISVTNIEIEVDDE
ncbi:hydrogenase nickel incorporation protein HypA/HybF [Methanomicrobium sp. W14]|uniref:hydrogenase maturation nickel metallochaperone HypA/HybF n=1 Tax=Methanomicrobium sp. W14 TaxID=2817839 RepID=UPI001AEAC6DD|nr:hydrogenase maturation nickel metallochaperone HypA [Methanomicrobium sp. W14]MBP2132286.1 hydrogenase nickel incorporation protein HypA/HybF [Methanomicrobium sp. W14]